METENPLKNCGNLDRFTNNGVDNSITDVEKSAHMDHSEVQMPIY